MPNIRNCAIILLMQCQCDCPVGICFDSNEQCYIQCSDSIDINPFAGCAPGWDCPWFFDATANHCKSEMHQTETYVIYRTAKECCEANTESATCIQESQGKWYFLEKSNTRPELISDYVFVI